MNTNANYNDIFHNEDDNIYQLDLGLNDISLSNINPVIAGIAESKPGNTSYGPLFRSLFHIHFVYRGKGYFENCFGKFEVNAGQGFYFAPGELINYYPDDDNPWSYSWIGFEINDTAILDTIDISQKNPIFNLPNGFDSEYEFSIIQSLNSGREYYCLSILYKIFSFNPRHNNNNNNIATTVANYILNNISFDLSNQTIAQHFGYNKHYFGRIFKKATSQSLQEYILNTRMVLARDFIIKNRNCPRIDIARSVGYSEYSTFSKVYKKYWGYSPSKTPDTDILPNTQLIYKPKY